MFATIIQSCPSCGARVLPTEPCPICGWKGEELLSEAAPEREQRCPRCQHPTSEGARFCIHRGLRLGGSDPDSGLGRLRRKQGLVLIGAALLWSILLIAGPGGLRTGARPEAGALLPPLTEAQQARAAELERTLAETPDAQRRLRLLEDLLHLYQEAGRPDLGARALSAQAEIEASAALWRRAGDLYTDWMLRQSDPGLRQEALQQAVEAYRKALELNPEDLDVRVDLAFCYAQSPENPMQAVAELNAVLERDSLHARANLLLGLLRMQIGRFREAAEAFDRVLLRAERGSELYTQAEMLRREAINRSQPAN